jgi:hypothetical protein
LADLLAFFQNEGYGHVDLLSGNIAVLDHDVHVLDPDALDVAEGAGGPLDALVDGVLEALLRGGTQLGNMSYSHKYYFFFLLSLKGCHALASEL